MRRIAFGRPGRLGLVALGLALGLSIPSVARAAEVVLRVDGLSCPFCTFGIEKKLMEVPGVVGMDIQLNDGKVILQLRPGERLDAVALDRAVDDAGFTLRKILVENAVGTLSQADDGELLFQASDPPSSFRLRLKGGDALPGAPPAPGATRVEVTGELTEYVAEPAPLAVTSLRRVGPRAGGPR